MVYRLILAVGLGLAASAAFAKNGCTLGAEFEPPLCPLSLPKIERVTIVENGATSPANPGSAQACSGFVLTEQNVRRHFAGALQTNPLDAHNTLDWSPCFASGMLTFMDGMTARWSIMQSRIGTLILQSGDAITLYCPACHFKPFR